MDELTWTDIQPDADYGVEEVAELFVLSVRSVMRLKQKGHLISYKLVGTHAIRFKGADIMEYRKKSYEEMSREDRK